MTSSRWFANTAEPFVNYVTGRPFIQYERSVRRTAVAPVVSAKHTLIRCHVGFGCYGAPLGVHDCIARCDGPGFVSCLGYSYNTLLQFGYIPRVRQIYPLQCVQLGFKSEGALSSVSLR